jgi:hypothetical protein
MTRLYYFEIDGDKYIGEYAQDEPEIKIGFCNARFFSNKIVAKSWYIVHCKDFPNAVLCSFECVGFAPVNAADGQREE